MSKYVAAIPVWVRALLVVASSVALYGAASWVGLVVVRHPQAVFGEAANLSGLPASLFSVAAVLCLIWVLARTPFALATAAFPETEKGGVRQ